MTDAITLSDDERAFESYLNSLSSALQHASRERPFRDYCTGLLLPDGERGTDGGAAGALHHPDDAQEAVELRVGWSDAAAMRRQVLPVLEAHGAVRRWIVDEWPRRARPRSAWPASTDTVGEFRQADQLAPAISAAKRDWRVLAGGIPHHQASSLTMLMASAVRTCWRWVLA